MSTILPVYIQEQGYFTLKCKLKRTLCKNVTSSLLSLYEQLLPSFIGPTAASCIAKKKNSLGERVEYVISL